MHIQILTLKQDDPKKCTAERLIKFDLAKRARRYYTNSVVLNPFSSRLLMPRDKSLCEGVVAIDCSWERAGSTFEKRLPGIHRRLPPLLAGNPVNYAKFDKLTTAEAVAATLYLLGEHDHARTLLDKFKWGHTFFELNEELLHDYTTIDSEHEVKQVLSEYGIES